MKTTTKRKVNYKHIIEILSIIALVVFAHKVHMLDGVFNPVWLGYYFLLSICGLTIYIIESIFKLLEIAKARYRVVKATIEAEKVAIARRNSIQCLITNPKKLAREQAERSISAKSIIK